MSKKQQDRDRLEVTLDFWRNYSTDRLLQRLNEVLAAPAYHAIRTVLRERGIDPGQLNTATEDERNEGA